MKKLFTLILSVYAFCSTTITANAQVDINDSLALVDLYNSTNGPNWANSYNWLIRPVKDWYGITVDMANRVSSIQLDLNHLSGQLPPSLGSLTNLQYLNLQYNELSGPIPIELSSLSSLTTLSLNDNQLRGSIPPEFAMLSNLHALALDFNQLSGAIPAELGKLAHLEYLYLNNNQLSGNIPPELGNLHLLTLYLFSNQLSGSIPPELGKLSHLVELYLFSNQLSGSIPAQLGNLSSLKYSNFSYNQLSGSIPPELGKLSSLQSLYLNNNQLGGTIPSELGNLSNLGDLSLGQNQLSGSIPPELGNLSSIYQLSLDNNQLSGSIPPELGNLSQLQLLQLNNNNLSGIIPSFDALYYNNATINFSYNQFTFEGMEKIAQRFFNALYYPQARITANINGNTISVSAGGTLSNNTYLWVKKGQKDVIRITGDSTFHPTESGTYAVRVKNKIATELKLTSHIIRYTAPVAANAITSNKSGILNEGFSVYPNPAKDVLHITTNGRASFSLVSKTGKILFTTNIDKTGTLNVSTLAAGDYYLKNNNTNVSKKVVVIR